MVKKNINSERYLENLENTTQISFDTSLKTRIAYCHGTLIDTITPINWGFLGFTFYFAVVGLPIIYLTIATIIFAFWDAFNDPIIGVISDRTKSRIGRRKIWLYVTSIPMAIIIILLWTPPLDASHFIIFIYYLVVIMVFDLVYTFYTVNINALWPEMFLTTEERTNIGFWRNIFMIIAVALAYLVPGLIIEDMANRRDLPQTPTQYLVSGITIAVIVFISFIILLKWGVFERKEFAQDVEKAPKLLDSFKITLKNKAFVLYCIVQLCVYCVYGILLTIMPLYGTFVLGLAEENSFLIGLLVFACLIIGVLSTPMWIFLQKKYGIRKIFMICMGYWAISLLLFITATDILTAFLFIAIMGPGLGGAIYFYDQGMAEIIDDDSVRTGLDVRREGAYYGVSALFNRFAGIFNILVISFIFTQTGWGQYDPNPGVDVILGLRFLMGIYPLFIISVALLCLYLYPIHGKRLDENKIMLAEQRAKKQRELSTSF